MSELADIAYNESAISQLLVPGCNIETGADNALAGFIRDEGAGQDSWERAVTAGHFAKQNKSIGTVIFSGQVSFMVPEWDRPNVTVATAMDTVAHEIYEAIPSVREEQSRSPYGNLIESVRQGLLDPHQKTGVVIHKDLAERFLRAARFVLPFTEFEVIPVDTPGSTEKRKPNRNDRIADALYRVAMRGVQPGDIDTIARRDEMVQRNVQRGMKVARNLRLFARALVVPLEEDQGEEIGLAIFGEPA